MSEDQTTAPEVTEVVDGENTPKKSRAKAKPAADEDRGDLVEVGNGIAFYIRK